MVKSLTVAQKWAEGIKDCVTKIELKLSHQDSSFKKIHIDYVNELLTFNPVPCKEPHYHKLKVLWQQNAILFLVVAIYGHLFIVLICSDAGICKRGKVVSSRHWDCFVNVFQCTFLQAFHMSFLHILRTLLFVLFCFIKFDFMI